MNCAILQLGFHLQSARFRRQADDVGTGVNGLLIGQREPKEVEPTNPFPITQHRAGRVPLRPWLGLLETRMGGHSLTGQ